MNKQRTTHTPGQDTAFDLRELLVALCRKIFVQSKFCENETGVGLPVREREYLRTLRPSVNLFSPPFRFQRTLIR